MNNNRLIKIIVPVLIAAVIAVIWFVKNSANELPLSGEDKGGTSVTSTAKLKYALEITSVNMADIKSHGLPIIIDFGSDSCDACKAMAPVLKKMNADMQGKAIIHFVDVWKHTGAGNDFPLRAIPTQVLITADGKPYVPGEEIQKTIAFTMYTTKDTDEHVFTVHEGGLTEEEFGAILADMGVK